MNIIAKDYTGLIKALLNAGVNDLSLVKWVRQPVRVNGSWVAEIEL